MYPGERSAVFTLHRVTLSSYFNTAPALPCSSPEGAGRAWGCGVVMVVLWLGATMERETLGGVGDGELGRWDTYILDTGDCAPYKLNTFSTM